jgi:hypothetical protein
MTTGNQEIKLAGKVFLIREADNYSLAGSLPGSSTICPSEQLLTVKLVDPVTFDLELIKQDCFGDLTYRANIFGTDPAVVVFRWLDENDQVVSPGQILNPISFGRYKLDVQPANSTAYPIPPKEFEIKEPILSVEVSIVSTKLYKIRSAINSGTFIAYEWYFGEELICTNPICKPIQPGT